jgi:DNA-binding response OmpR family regulator
VEAGDGSAAFTLARAQRFDLVVTDSRMPKMNSQQLVTSLRLLDSSLCILFVSASYGESSAAGKMPADVPTLSKPSIFAELVREAEDALRPSHDIPGGRILAASPFDSPTLFRPRNIP